MRSFRRLLILAQLKMIKVTAYFKTSAGSANAFYNRFMFNTVVITGEVGAMSNILFPSFMKITPCTTKVLKIVRTRTYTSLYIHILYTCCYRFKIAFSDNQTYFDHTKIITVVPMFWVLTSVGSFRLLLQNGKINPFIEHTSRCPATTFALLLPITRYRNILFLADV